MPKDKYMALKVEVAKMFKEKVDSIYKDVDFSKENGEYVKRPFYIGIPLSQMIYNYCIGQRIPIRYFNEMSFMVALIRNYRCPELEVKKVNTTYKLQDGRTIEYDEMVCEGLIRFPNPMFQFNRTLKREIDIIDGNAKPKKSVGRPIKDRYVPISR